jgi:hypothetical protein
MDNAATQDNSELNTKHKTKKTDKEIKNGPSSDSDNSELSTEQRKPIGIKNGQSSESENSELSTKHRTKKTDREIKNGQSSDSRQQ